MSPMPVQKITPTLSPGSQPRDSGVGERVLRPPTMDGALEAGDVPAAVGAVGVRRDGRGDGPTPSTLLRRGPS